MIPTYNNFVSEQLLLRAEEFSLHIYHFTYIYIVIFLLKRYCSEWNFVVYVPNTFLTPLHRYLLKSVIKVTSCKESVDEFIQALVDCRHLTIQNT